MLTACIMFAACSCDLQYRLNGDSTLAHSWSQEVGKPLAQSVAAPVQHAALTACTSRGGSVHVSLTAYDDDGTT